MVDPFWRHIPDIVACLLVAGAHHALARWSGRAALKRIIWTLAAWVLCSILLSLPPMAIHLPSSYFLSWFRGAGIAWGICSLGVFLLLFTWRRIPKPRFNPGRRRLLIAAHTAAVAGPVAAIGYGAFIGRHDLSVRETRIPFPGLPKDLDGLSVVQLTDMHSGPFLSRRELARAVDMANETGARIAVVTGDLITAVNDPLDDCLRELARLRSDAGVFGCLGNHEVFAEAESYTTREGARLGIQFLRREVRKLRFGNATLNLAGVDYQRMRHPYLVGAEALVSPADFNVLLSHNPDVFPVAAAKGFALTLSGHTHGGQISVEILNEHLSVARFFTPYVNGLYRLDSKAIYVSRGVGTVGVPARIGAPPEVSLIRLCAT
jgi:predicted MPP superfamily phosphohydrolase